LLKNSFLKTLADKETVPFLGCTVGAILFGVGTTHVDLFFSPRKRVHLKGSTSNVFGGLKKNLKVSGSKIRVVVHYLGQVDEPNFDGGFGSVFGEEMVDHIKKNRCHFFNSFVRN
jgi:hypothetical protein